MLVRHSSAYRFKGRFYPWISFFDCPVVIHSTKSSPSLTYKFLNKRKDIYLQIFSSIHKFDLSSYGTVFLHAYFLYSGYSYQESECDFRLSSIHKVFLMSGDNLQSTRQFLWNIGMYKESFPHPSYNSSNKFNTTLPKYRIIYSEV